MKVFAALAAVLACSLWPCPAQAATPPGTIDKLGTYTFAQLGSHDLRLTAAGAPQTIRVTLPATAAQGPSLWWQLFLHADVAFPATARGTWYLDGLVNGTAAASVEFNLDAGPPGGMAWNTVDITGEVKHSQSTRQAVVDFSNYIQVDGIRPGPAVVAFQLHALDAGSPAPTVTIAAGRSGLVWSTENPDSLQISLSASKDSPIAGKDFTVHYVVRNTASTPAKSVSILVDDAARVKPRQAQHIVVGEVRSTKQGTLTFHATTSGHTEIVVHVANDKGKIRATKIVELDVVAGHRSLFRVAIIVIGCAGVAIGIIVMRRARRRA